MHQEWIGAVNPFDMTTWGPLERVYTSADPEGTDGHENIPLDSGRIYTIFRTHMSHYDEVGPNGAFYGRLREADGTWGPTVTLGSSDGTRGSDRRLCHR